VKPNQIQVYQHRTVPTCSGLCVPGGSSFSEHRPTAAPPTRIRRPVIGRADFGYLPTPGRDRRARPLVIRVALRALWGWPISTGDLARRSSVLTRERGSPRETSPARWLGYDATNPWGDRGVHYRAWTRAGSTGKLPVGERDGRGIPSGQREVVHRPRWIHGKGACRRSAAVM